MWGGVRKTGGCGIKFSALKKKNYCKREIVSRMGLLRDKLTKSCNVMPSKHIKY